MLFAIRGPCAWLLPSNKPEKDIIVAKEQSGISTKKRGFMMGVCAASVSRSIDSEDSQESH
jgi:hypothetical protein